MTTENGKEKIVYTGIGVDKETRLLAAKLASILTKDYERKTGVRAKVKQAEAVRIAIEEAIKKRESNN